MKKGFSVIEMAVALIVIGVIIAMILEGTSLIESGKIKAEIQKINKIQSAYATFYTKNDRTPGSVATAGAPAYTPKAIYEELMETGLLTDADFTNTYIKGFWSFQGCESKPITGGTASSAGGTYWNQINLSASDLVCLAGVRSNPRTDVRVNKTISYTETAISQRFACYIETTLDEGSIYFGKGRGTSSAGDLDTKMDARCDKYTDRAGMGGAYLFRIF